MPACLHTGSPFHGALPPFSPSTACHLCTATAFFFFTLASSHVPTYRPAFRAPLRPVLQHAPSAPPLPLPHHAPCCRAAPPTGRAALRQAASSAALPGFCPPSAANTFPLPLPTCLPHHPCLLFSLPAFTAPCTPPRRVPAVPPPLPTCLPAPMQTWRAGRGQHARMKRALCRRLGSPRRTARYNVSPSAASPPSPAFFSPPAYHAPLFHAYRLVPFTRRTATTPPHRFCFSHLCMRRRSLVTHMPPVPTACAAGGRLSFCARATPGLNAAFYPPTIASASTLHLRRTRLQRVALFGTTTARGFGPSGNARIILPPSARCTFRRTTRAIN